MRPTRIFARRQDMLNTRSFAVHRCYLPSGIDHPNSRGYYLATRRQPALGRPRHGQHYD